VAGLELPLEKVLSLERIGSPSTQPAESCVSRCDRFGVAGFDVFAAIQHARVLRMYLRARVPGAVEIISSFRGFAWDLASWSPHPAPHLSPNFFCAFPKKLKSMTSAAATGGVTLVLSRTRSTRICTDSDLTKVSSVINPHELVQCLVGHLPARRFELFHDDVQHLILISFIPNKRELA